MSTTAKQIVIRVKFSNRSAVIRSYKYTDDDRLQATKSSEEYHVRDVIQWMPREELNELLDEYLAEVRYLGYQARLVLVNESSYDVD